MVYLQQLKRDAEFKIRYVKRVPFVTRGYTKGVPFLSKMVHTKGKGLVPGAEPLVSTPPPPLWVTVTLVWFFSLISLILCFIKWIKIHLKASCPFFENPDMLKEIMSPGGEIKSGKMGSKIYCVILHALSNWMWPLYTYSCTCLLKNILALQSFTSHHLCETLDSLFPKLQTACLKAYQPPSNKLPTSATLMMWCLMAGALQYYWIKLIKQLDNTNWFKSLIHSVLHWAWNIFLHSKNNVH